MQRKCDVVVNLPSSSSDRSIAMTVHARVLEAIAIVESPKTRRGKRLLAALRTRSTRAPRLTLKGVRAELRLG
ncbi:hypothetical protein AKJ09_00283 [Labilithrix luteola]|uniref:Uncharacterized protein n=1 Tax=Labilithrix luteola TaxID=1391654 RepID=A0A0K1PKI1_9BACT|nr:hypothetical protein AKJ09_00283 [Labilithrix luteola]